MLESWKSCVISGTGGSNSSTSSSFSSVTVGITGAAYLLVVPFG
jgi:hypothetical protein